jgi:hypothetical protein
MGEIGTKEAEAVKAMTTALELLKKATPSRENSLVITKLEEAMMWCNKDRTIKGELTPNSTHV